MTQVPEGLPEAAMRRLAELGDRSNQIFTSDLSVNEFLLVKEAGFHPLGLVLGSSIYHVGLQMGRWNQNQELTTLTQAMYHARELAMSRMTAEAAQMGADGVVGVRLEMQRKEFGNDITEFIAVGTAVKAEGEIARLNWKTNTGAPFTSDLSGQDFWTLLQSGHAPLGLVLGTCVYHIAHRGMGSMIKSAGQNTELPKFTQALYEARELAMGRMQSEAERLGAEGIVGVVLDSHNHTWGGHTTEFLAVGTAVKPYIVDHVIKPPAMVIGLDK